MSVWNVIDHPGPRYSFQKSLLLIVLSLVVTAMIGLSGIFGYRTFLKEKAREKVATIQKIAQASTEYQPLKTPYLAEMLGLSQDKPTFFYPFDAREAEKKLQHTAVIKEVRVKKIKPHTLFIDYTLRLPLAYVGDYSNTALDEEGILFPFSPFFTPKKLPTIFFGQEVDPSKVWGSQIFENKIQLVKEILSFFKDETILQIDLSSIGAHTLGQRQLVVVLKKEKGSHVLRLTTKHYKEEIQNYFRLSKTVVKEKNCIVDLRLPEMAYLTGEVVD